jgi:predicted lipoprotein with Yx(FWY)xxD motif
MTNMISSRKASLALKVGAPLAAAGILAAACSSSGGSSGSSNSAPSATGGSTSTATVNVRTSNGTTFLTDKAGRSLYLFGSDSKTTSTCTGACATAWPPLTATTAPTAGAGAKASDLSTITRSDGTKQVTYAGHPLYSFSGDKAAGQINGEGSTAFGAPWYVVSPAGQQITSVSGASAPAGGGGGGGGY